MRTELVSTVRPTRLRVAGFLALTLGALLISFGSLTDWATVPPFGTPTRGVDLWEGTLTLAMGVAILVGMIAMRLVGAAAPRRAAAALILVLGIGAAVLAGSVVARAHDRFTAPDQRDRIARDLSTQLGVPYAEVRARVEAAYDARFHVSLDPGIFAVVVGGAIAAAGGGLSVAWASRT
jgi:hypothetical protein